MEILGGPRERDERRQVSTPWYTVTYTDAVETMDPARLGVGDIPNLDLIFTLRGEKRPYLCPNMVVHSFANDRPLVDAAYVAYRTAVNQRASMRMLSYSLVVDPDPPNAVIGRTFSYVYKLDAIFDMLVRQWVFATGGRHVVFTLSCLPFHAPALQGYFRWLVHNVSFGCGLKQLVRNAALPPQTKVARNSELKHLAPTLWYEDVAEYADDTPRRAPRILAKDAQSAVTGWGFSLKDKPVVAVRVRGAGQECRYAAYYCRQRLLVVRTAGPNAYKPVAGRVEIYGLTFAKIVRDVFAWLELVPQLVPNQDEEILYSDYRKHLSDKAGKDAWFEIAVPVRGDQWLHVVRKSKTALYMADIPGDGTARLVRCAPEVIGSVVLGNTAQYVASIPPDVTHP